MDELANPLQLISNSWTRNSAHFSAYARLILALEIIGLPRNREGCFGKRYH
jgi:hypothetical protein